MPKPARFVSRLRLPPEPRTRPAATPGDTFKAIERATGRPVTCQWVKRNGPGGGNGPRLCVRITAPGGYRRTLYADVFPDFYDIPERNPDQ